MDRKTYETKFDSLSKLKTDLLLLKKQLNNEIDSLSSASLAMDNLIIEERKNLYVLRYGKENGNRVFNGQIWTGMSESMLNDSWGKPDKIDKNAQKWGTYTQWYYGEITFFFKNGILFEWEEK